MARYQCIYLLGQGHEEDQNSLFEIWCAYHPTNYFRNLTEPAKKFNQWSALAVYHDHWRLHQFAKHGHVRHMGSDSLKRRRQRCQNIQDICNRRRITFGYMRFRGMLSRLQKSWKSISRLSTILCNTMGDSWSKKNHIPALALIWRCNKHINDSSYTHTWYIAFAVAVHRIKTEWRMSSN